MPSPKNDKAARLLELFIRIVAIGVPVLYVIGRVYAEGYWSALGLSSGLASYDVDDYLYLGFFALVNASAIALGVPGDHTFLVVIVGGLMLSFATILVITIEHWMTVFFSSHLKKADERSAEWRRKHQGAIRKFGHPAVIIGAGFYALVYIVGMSLFAAFLAVLVVHNVGIGSGRREIQRFAKLEDSPGGVREHASTVHYVDRELTRREGLLLDCSADWCFVFQGGKFVAIPSGTVVGIGSRP